MPTTVFYFDDYVYGHQLTYNMIQYMFANKLYNVIYLYDDDIKWNAILFVYNVPVDSNLRL